MSELTTSQAAERLGVGASTVRLWCTQGRFPNARAETTPRGGVWLIPESDLKDFQPPKRGRTPKSLPATQTPATGHANASNGEATVAAKATKKGGKK